MKDYLMFIITIQIAMLVVVVLNIPIARQVIGFIYVSFIPGFLVLKILRLNPKSRTNTVLLSVGLSIAFLMFIGLAANELYPILGVSKPLSIVPLSATIGTVLLVMTLISYKRDDLTTSSSLPSLGHILRMSPLVGLVLLAVFGALLANSLILLLFVLAVVVVVAITVFSKKLIPPESYVIVILVIAVSILFHSAFISQYLQGYDVLSEFYVFRLTKLNSLWNPAAISVPVTALPDAGALSGYNGMLSVTILPTVYSTLLNLSGEWMFQFGYLLIYSLVPVSMYQMYKQGFGKSAAFLSALYFVIFPRFYGEERRQIIGELFFVLLIFLILDRNINPKEKKILLCVFGAALVVSHYSMSYIFMFGILLAWVIISIFRRFPLVGLNLREKQLITTAFVLLIIALNVFWYMLVSPVTGQTLIGFFSNIVNSFTSSFSSVGSRGGTVSEFVAPDLGSMSFAYKIDYVINKIPYLLIIIGFLALFKNYRKIKISLEYVLMVLASVSILLMVLVVPSFAPAFLADRFYHVSLLLLAPVCIYGGLMLLGWILKPVKKIKSVPSVSVRAICILLIAIFLFKVGFVYAVMGDVARSRQIGFSSMKASNSSAIQTALYEWYIPGQDVYSAIWLSHMTENDSKIYEDNTANIHVLRAYGMKIMEWQYILTNRTMIQHDAYVYLRYINVQGWLKDEGGFSNITGFSNQLDMADKIYSDGSDIYYSPPGG